MYSWHCADSRTGVYAISLCHYQHTQTVRFRLRDTVVHAVTGAHLTRHPAQLLAVVGESGGIPICSVIMPLSVA